MMISRNKIRHRLGSVQWLHHLNTFSSSFQKCSNLEESLMNASRRRCLLRVFDRIIDLQHGLNRFLTFVVLSFTSQKWLKHVLTADLNKKYVEVLVETDSNNQCKRLKGWADVQPKGNHKDIGRTPLSPSHGSVTLRISLPFNGY